MNIPAALQDICCDNKDALEFCASFYDFVHVLDDLIDRDKEQPQEVICGAFLRFIGVLSFNPFFAAHRERLYALIHAAVATYIHSNQLLAKEGVKDRVVGEVLKSEYQNILYFVAFLVGGWTHQLKMQEKYREHDFG